MNVTDPSTPVVHPRTWMAVRDILDLQLRVHGQLNVDLVAVGHLAVALGVAVDVDKAIRCRASVSDLLDELREALLFERVNTESDREAIAKSILSARP
jgi:hypothetical protein